MTSEVNLLNDKTVGDLYAYLVAAARDGEISTSLSDHLRTAVKKIFTTTCRPDEFWQSVPLASVDIDARIAMLRAKTFSACSDQTIHVYHTRYVRSVRLYLEHLQRQTLTAPLPPAVSPPSSPAISPSVYLLATQKILAASIKFQQEVLEAMSLITEKKGGPPSSA